MLRDQSKTAKLKLDAVMLVSTLSSCVTLELRPNAALATILYL